MQIIYLQVDRQKKDRRQEEKQIDKYNTFLVALYFHW